MRSDNNFSMPNNDIFMNLMNLMNNMNNEENTFIIKEGDIEDIKKNLSLFCENIRIDKTFLGADKPNYEYKLSMGNQKSFLLNKNNVDSIVVEHSGTKIISLNLQFGERVILKNRDYLTSNEAKFLFTLYDKSKQYQRERERTNIEELIKNLPPLEDRTILQEREERECFICQESRFDYVKIGDPSHSNFECQPCCWIACESCMPQYISKWGEVCLMCKQGFDLEQLKKLN